MVRRIVTALGAAALIAANGCGEDDQGETPPAGGTGGTTTTGSATGGAGGGGGEAGGGGQGGGGGCNNLVNEAAVVQVMQIAEALPAAEGGELLTGLYRLTAVHLYTGAGGETGPTGGQQQETAQYDGALAQVVMDRYQGDGEQRFTFGYTADKDTGAISWTVPCPEPINVPYDRYTFTAPDTLALYASSVNLAFVYTLVDAH